jgi:hypothetical protein
VTPGVHTGRDRRRRGAILVALVGLVAVCALWRPDRRVAAPPPVAPPARVVARDPSPRPSPVPVQPAAVATRSTPRAPAGWRARVRGALDRHIRAAGLDQAVSETQRQDLVAVLLDVRRASRALQRRRPDPARAAQHRQALVESDRVFRDTLGIGVGQLVVALGPPGQIEDVGADRP